VRLLGRTRIESLKPWATLEVTFSVSIPRKMKHGPAVAR
jgi:hypothetical protein